MPDPGSRHPQPAFVEDWDDEAQTTLSSSRATANVAVKRAQTGLVSEKASLKAHDGSDSGYSSRAPTVGSASTGLSRMAGLKVDTTLSERERHPYMVSAKGGAVRRESFTRPSAVREVSAPVSRDQPFVHSKGVCMTCDYYGQHIDITSSSSAVQPLTPTSPKASKKSSNASRKEADPVMKRYSTAPEPRPQFVQAPAVQPTYSTSPNVNYASWSTAATPVVYSYATPTTSTYVGPAGQASYFDAKPTSDPRPKASQRTSSYGEPVIQQKFRDEIKAKGKPEKDSHLKPSTSRSADLTRTESFRQADSRPVAQARRGSDYRRRNSIDDDYDSRPSKSISEDHYSRPGKSINEDYDTRPSKSINNDYATRPSNSIKEDHYSRPSKSITEDYHNQPTRPINVRDRAQQELLDKINMPPPTDRPKKQPEIARRPSLRKSTTYNPETIEHRRSRGQDYEDVDVRIPPSPKRREASPPRPPSSYRPPTTEAPPRPQPSRKSVSYSDPVTSTTAKMASSSPAKKRSSKDPVSSMETKAAEAEAYQASRSSMTSHDLTVERLHDLKNERSRTQTLSSETGSGYSHRESHHSSSRSSGRGRSHTSAAGTRTSILIDEGLKLEIPADYRGKGRPVSIDLGGGMMLSVGAKDSGKSKDKDKQRMLEKPPSVSSHTSKRSGGNYDDRGYGGGREREREMEREREREKDRNTPASAVESTSTSSHTNASTKSSRRISRTEERDRRPPVADRGLTQQKSTRSSSRAPSVTRTARRQSGGYDGGYGGW